MIQPSKDKCPFKPSSKSSQRLQSSKTNEVYTVRNKNSSTKNPPTQKIIRSPQTIRLMIQQLQKQLIKKTKPRKITHSIDPEFSKTKPNIKKHKHTELSIKNTINSQNKLSRSPTKNQKAKHQEHTISSLFDKTVSKSFPKITNYPASQTTREVQRKKKKNAASAKESSKGQIHQKQNYIFLDDNMIKFSNLQLPLFIIDNGSQFLGRSEQPSLRNDNKSLLIDEKKNFIRHSNLSSSFDSINSKTYRNVNYIERSFCQSEQSQQEGFNNLSFLRLNFLEESEKKQPVQRQIKVNVGKQEKLEDKVNFKQTKININQVIQLNNSVVRIQKWWRNKNVALRTGKSVQKNIKQSLQSIETKEEESQKYIEASSGGIYVQKKNQSLSQKNIALPVTSDQRDILKLRQNAVYIQYSAHEKILRQLLNKGKINSSQFQHQIQVIKDNLSTELIDIEKIRKILKQSEQKVEIVMNKTKLDILAVQKIVLAGDIVNENATDGIDSSQLVSHGEKHSIVHKQDILSIIFGGTEAKIISNYQTETETSNKHSVKKPQKVENLHPKKYQRIKIPTYQTQLEEFSNQKSSDEQSSFLSNHSTPIFNSLQLNSEQNFTFPTSNQNLQNLSSSQNLEDETFACEIERQPSSTVVQEVGSSAFPITANFQELYQEYQTQQQSKKDMQTRISKQLGVGGYQKPYQQLQISINTSIVAIHKFLLNFFKFYLYYHKQEFLTYMNMPYGESIETRLAKNRMKSPQYTLQEWTRTSFYTDDDEEIIYGLKSVIPEAVLQDFFNSYYEQTDVNFTQAEKTNIELQKTHNRAVFHAFNHALNFFRPYYNIGGAPYLWCSSQKSLTFFCIGEDNIQEVYEKTQIKILKNSSHLCGLIIDLPHKNSFLLENNELFQSTQMDSPFKLIENKVSYNNVRKIRNFDEFLNSYTENFNPTYLANLQQRLKKKELIETQEQNLEWFGNTFEEGKVSTLLNLTEIIEQILLLEECSILNNINYKEMSKI